MEEKDNTFTINKNYVYALAVLLVVLLGLALYINDKVNELPNTEDNATLEDNLTNVVPNELTLEEIFKEEEINTSNTTPVPEGTFDMLENSTE